MFIHSKKGSQLRFKAKIFNALSDSTRLEALEFLHATEKCVCEIIPHVGLIQPVISRHLRILKDCGLVRDRKDSNRRLYSITDRRIFDRSILWMPLWDCLLDHAFRKRFK
jgi:ArsR family transcriptional regulator